MTPLNADTDEPRLSHWRELVDCREAPTRVEDYELTLEAICARLENLGPDAFDFSGLDPDCCSPEHLAAALRFTSSHHESIPTWREGLLRCIDACAKQGMDARDLLMGLL